MGFIDIITKLFGNKSQKDMKAVMPYVDKIKAVYAEIDALSDDDLRARSALLMQRLQDAVADNKSKIIELKAGIEELEIDQREKVYNEIDRIEKDIKETYEKIRGRDMYEKVKENILYYASHIFDEFLLKFRDALSLRKMPLPRISCYLIGGLEVFFSLFLPKKLLPQSLQSPKSSV